MKFIYEWLNTRVGPVAIQAGHFFLIVHKKRCVPAVKEELDRLGIYPSFYNQLENCIAEFPSRTWTYGIEVLQRLQKENRDSCILTVVNDWQYVRKAENLSPGQARHQFYSIYRNLFENYKACLNNAEMSGQNILCLDRFFGFISETWLRHRIQRRLKNLAKNTTTSSLEWKQDQNEHRDLVFNDLSQACKLLVCGQADCAGEVMELVYQLYAKGYRNLINFIPEECEHPVNEGTRRALALFRFPDFSVLNISVPFFSKDFGSIGAKQKFRVHEVEAKRAGANSIETFIKPIGLR